ncbi:hypothetical protein RUND412_007736 [Rhizina undulata]
MTRPLPAGAYIIRNKTSHGMVLRTSGTNAETFHHSPPRQREEEIWWVEPIPDSKYQQEEGRIYIISNIPRGVSLETAKSELFVNHSHGEQCQQWRINPVRFDRNGIINVYTKKAVDINHSASIITSEFTDASSQQRWEFLIPRVDVPAGWNYLSSPPFLAPVHYGSNLSNLRETWGAQWALILPSAHNLDSAHNGWCIKNRLTNGLLNIGAMRYGESVRDAVIAAEFIYDQQENQKWELVEKNRDGYWAIKNTATKNLLENSPQNQEEHIANGITCVRKNSLESDGADLWEFS